MKKVADKMEEKNRAVCREEWPGEKTKHERKIAVERLQEAIGERPQDVKALLWETLLLFQAYPFHTAKGLEFTYTIKGNEIFFSRKEKSITRATVNRALDRTMELGRVVTGPKKLGCFGASYIYPVFQELSVIRRANPPQQLSFEMPFLENESGYLRMDNQK